MAESILIIDDEVLTLKNLKKALEKEDYEVLLADTGESGIDVYKKHHPNLALVDLMLPGINGIEVLKKIKEMDPNTVVIMITAYEIIEKAVEAMKLGAYDYLLKPFKISDLKATVARGLELQSLRIRVSETVETEKGKYYFDKMIARNKKMIEVVETARKIASLGKTSVLITGESGVGKGLLARAIHYNSPRADQQFIEINCAAIPENLLESELYGYEPGAFTDARRRKIGLFEKADRGTIFLDEIADMPVPLQAKVLKVLEEQSFTRLGGTNVIKIDVRFITASNKDLKKEIQEGNFREDLFYRLNVVPIKIPPLKARTEDIIPLALSFIHELNQELHKSFEGVSEDVAKVLLAYEWPGNVRELRNVIERIMALHHSEEILLEHVPLEIRAPAVRRETAVLQETAETQQFVTLDELEMQYIKQVIDFTGGNKSKAAKILGIHITSLFRKLKSMK
ncbi:Fis family transcriptional regulator [candidate division WOR_3 bacterium SM23_60]|uniref:Fis family transcriptional regulator n=1 Tax=candidate division WOR_3 bacterium SM23_60 TaxID=1703780 RepID=A0A0S8GKS1_UNCW3|nr:MAG: Fis family transcriptional regulator [candidate division WOR_3 bacterium SM23_60]